MKSERIDLRVTCEEKMAWFDAARAEKLKLADWIRLRCNAHVTVWRNGGTTLPMQSAAKVLSEIRNREDAKFTVVEEEPRLRNENERKPCKHSLLFCKKCK